MNRLDHAKKDYLTSCYGREDMSDILRELEEDCKAGQKKFSLLVADIDHFKSFNDKYGHFFGDDVLKYFGEALRIHLDDFQNIPIRFGGDEFIMAFPGKSADEVYPLALGLKESLKVKPFDYKGCPIKVSFSAGIACYPDDGQTWEDVFEKADRAMYFAKRSGRSRITRYRNITGERVAWVAASGAIAFFTLVIVFLNFGHLFEGAFARAIGELKKSELAAPQVSEPPAMNPTPTFETQAVTPVPEKVPPLQEFYLKSGGVIQGVVEEETGDALIVRLKLSNGQGQIKISKDNLLKIEEI